MEFKIGTSTIGLDHPTYFVADIAANHDGHLEKAKKLIELAAAAGADAAKFQNFSAEKIVSDRGFRELGQQLGHQSTWEKSVFEVYKSASIPLDWTPHLKKTCDENGIDYFSAAYDFEALESLDPYVPAFKVGSGDLNWLEMLAKTAGKGKPVLLATGASSLDEVINSVELIQSHGVPLVLMQCNTNYTGSIENFKFQNLNVLKSYAERFPGVILGLSDHTPGHSTVLGAVALGARVVEKHFTDNQNQTGPDHLFSMNPIDWEEMVARTRELEMALGDGVKRVEANERETVIVQRRAIRAAGRIPSGKVIERTDISVLRPAPQGAFTAADLGLVLGKTTVRDIEAHSVILGDDLN
jgi:N-acetylneuraminate synthase